MTPTGGETLVLRLPAATPRRGENRRGSAGSPG